MPLPSRFWIIVAMLAALAAGAALPRGQPHLMAARAPGDGPTIVVGDTSIGPRSADSLALTYPQAAAQAQDGSIFIANALGFTVERLNGDEATTVLAGRPGDSHPSIFVDVDVADSHLYVLDGANGRVWRMTGDTAQAVFEAPAAPDFFDQRRGEPVPTSYFLSSLDVDRGRYLTIATRVLWEGAQQRGTDTHGLYLATENGGWTEVSIGRELVGRFGKLRDAAWTDDGQMIALAGSSLVLFDEQKEIASIGIGAEHGGGIVRNDDGWLVGAHTRLVAVSADLSAMREVPIRFPLANIGSLSWADNGALLLTDTDRQTIYEVDLDTGTALRQFGNSSMAMKVVSLWADGGRLLMLENATPRVLAYDPQRGSVRSIAGDGRQGYDSARAAGEFSFQFPSGIAVAPDGSIYVTEANYRIARVAGGRVSVHAGDIHAGSPVDGQDGREALFGALRGLAFDAAGRLLVVDQTNHSIWRFEPDGTITQVMGTGEPGQWREGEPAKDQPLNNPTGLLARADGSILIADSYNHTVARIGPDGRLSTFAGTITGTTYQGHGGFSGDGGPAVAAKLNTPRQLAEDEAGNVYIVDEFNNAIRKVSPDGTISTFVGGKFGFAPDGSHMNLPQSAAVLGDHLYVADTGNSIVWAFPLN